MFSNQILQKICNEYFCEVCDYKTVRKSSYDDHLLSRKHNKSMFVNQNLQKICNEFICQKCNKKYKDNSGLWRHKKKCNGSDFVDVEENNETIIQKNNSEKDELINYLIKENQEFKNLILEIVKKDTYQVTNNTTTNSHNKAFNLNFFLNETCKDAMNIKDFVDSVQLELSDLEKVGKSGYIEGISSIIIKNLNALEMEKRPIHCTDNKREVIYIKDEDKWEKEEDNKPKLKKLIKAIAHKNICMFKKFREKYPDCDNGDSKKSSVFNTIVYESMGGKGDDEAVKENKIIHKISKHVGIDKVHLTTF